MTVVGTVRDMTKVANLVADHPDTFFPDVLDVTDTPAVHATADGAGEGRPGQLHEGDLGRVRSSWRAGEHREPRSRLDRPLARDGGIADSVAPRSSPSWRPGALPHRARSQTSSRSSPATGRGTSSESPRQLWRHHHLPGCLRELARQRRVRLDFESIRPGHKRHRAPQALA